MCPDTGEERAFFNLLVVAWHSCMCELGHGSSLVLCLKLSVPGHKGFIFDLYLVHATSENLSSGSSLSCPVPLVLYVNEEPSPLQLLNSETRQEGRKVKVPAEK